MVCGRRKMSIESILDLVMTVCVVAALTQEFGKPSKDVSKILWIVNCGLWVLVAHLRLLGK